MKVRKSYIEFVRLFACLSIILVHVHIYETANDYLSIYINSFGVALFLMIIGYASYNKQKSYQKQLLKLLKLILLTLLTILISVIFYKWIIGKSSIINCLSSIKLLDFNRLIFPTIMLNIQDYKNITSHLWYINFYGLVLIMYPILNKMCTNKKDENLFRRIVLILLIIKMIFNDLIKLNIINNITYPPTIFNNDLFIYLIIGYEYYIHSSKKKNNKYIDIIISIILIATGLLWRNFFYTHASDTYYREKETIGTLLYSSGIFILLSNIGHIFKDNKIIDFIGDKTLGIYLIHYMIITKLKTCKFYYVTYNNMNKLTALQQFLWELLYAILIFILCLVIVTIIKYIFSKIKQLILHLKSTSK